MIPVTPRARPGSSLGNQPSSSRGEPRPRGMKAPYQIKNSIEKGTGSSKGRQSPATSASPSARPRLGQRRSEARRRRNAPGHREPRETGGAGAGQSYLCERIISDKKGLGQRGLGLRRTAAASPGRCGAPATGTCCPYGVGRRRRAQHHGQRRRAPGRAVEPVPGWGSVPVPGRGSRGPGPT